MAVRATVELQGLDDVVREVERAAKLISTDPTILEHLGHVYLRLGKKELAMEAWERALKQWPNSATSDFDAAQAEKLQ